MNGSDVVVTGGPPPRGRAALVKIGAPVHVGLSGPKRVKVTVPVGGGAGAAPAVTNAVSVMGLPSGAVGVAWVVTMPPSTTWVTTDVSSASLQALVTGT